MSARLMFTSVAAAMAAAVLAWTLFAALTGWSLLTAGAQPLATLPTPTFTPGPPDPKFAFDIESNGWAREVTSSFGDKGAVLGTCQAVEYEPACDVYYSAASPATVTVSIELPSAVGLVNSDGDGKTGYREWQILIGYGSGVYKDRAGLSEITWPNCYAPSASETIGDGTYRVKCSVAPGANESAHLGSLVRIDFMCDAPVDFQIMVGYAPFGNGTYLLGEDGSDLGVAAENQPWINCISSVGGVTELASLDWDGGHRVPTLIWVLAGIAAVAALPPLTAIARRYRAIRRSSPVRR